MQNTALKIFLLLSFAVITAVYTVSCGGGSENNDTTVRVSMPLLTRAEVHGSGIGWKRNDCDSCHSFASLPAPHPNIVEVTGMTQNEVCMMCHLGNGVDGRFNIPKCVNCHTDGNAFGAKAMSGAGFSMHTVTDKNAAQMSDIDCIICHDSTRMNGRFDYSDLSALTSEGAEWDKSNLNNFCLTCHSANGVYTQERSISGFNMKDVYPNDYHGDTVYEYEMGALRPDNVRGEPLSCLNCHRVHTSDNRKLFIMTGADARIVTDGDAKNAAVTLNGDDSDLRDLCVICHAGDTAHPDSVPAPNGLYQTTKHIEGYCFNCHRLTGPRPVGASIAINLMSIGGCRLCHKHGANMGPASVDFPNGIIHSRF